MYDIYIYGNIYHQYTPKVSIYTIHGPIYTLTKQEITCIIINIIYIYKLYPYDSCMLYIIYIIYGNIYHQCTTDVSIYIYIPFMTCIFPHLPGEGC